MAEYVFGANIIENLTTGMYQDSKVIFREYVQNACDQIDKAEELGILRQRSKNGKYPDLGEGVVDIWLNADKRIIVVEDNATGIRSADFERVLSSIADSDKVMGRDKGFRGIGRLCGLAYCKRLVFTSRWDGEDTVSTFTCDALKMRRLLNETNTKKQKHSARDVLEAINDFVSRPAEKDDPAHFFRVELIDISDENEELFGGKDDDNIERLTDYLSFIAPVPYQANFIYRSEIYAHSKEIDSKIDEYNIRINGQQILKKYKTHLKTGNGRDEVFGVEFQDFHADNGSLLGWMWFGKTSFKAAIKEEEISRGLRLRKENIQIGEDDALRDMFTREASKRGNNYFIGEVFATSTELIPNSQRAYFNETPTRIEFEHCLKRFFNNTLYYIYYEGSDINSSIKKINSFNKKAEEFVRKKAEGSFLSTEERDKEERELIMREQDAQKAAQNLERKRSSGKSILTAEIIERRVNEIPPKQGRPKIRPAEDFRETGSKKTKQKFLVDIMFPGFSRGERKLLSETLDKIFLIIRKSTDKKTAEMLVNNIKEELK